MGTFIVEHYRNAKLFAIYEFSNTLMRAGLEAMLQRAFYGDNTVDDWWLGLIQFNPDGVSVDIEDTMASHTGWVELEDYDYYDPYDTPNNSSRIEAVVTVERLIPEVLPPKVFRRANALFKRKPSDVRIQITFPHVCAGFFVCNDGERGGTDGLLLAATDYGKIELWTGDELMPAYRLAFGQDE